MLDVTAAIFWRVGSTPRAMRLGGQSDSERLCGSFHGVPGPLGKAASEGIDSSERASWVGGREGSKEAA